MSTEGESQTGYDRAAAVAYATNPEYSSPDRNEGFWKRFRNSNPEYERFDNLEDKLRAQSRLGSDCTNFVSQCLVEGGVQMNDDFYYKKQAEFVMIDGQMSVSKISRDMSPSWCNASDSYEYFSDPDNGYMKGDVLTINSIDELNNAVQNANIQTGDLLYLQNSDEGVHHAMMLTQIQDGTISYSAHSNDRINSPINSKLYSKVKHC